MRQIHYIEATVLLLMAGLYLIIIFGKRDIPLSIFAKGNARQVTNQSRPPEPTREESDVYLWPPCQRNDSAANVSGFYFLPGHIRDFLFYRHCRHFPMLLDVPDKCGGRDKSADVFLLLVIKTSPWNYDRREVLRKTWAKERLQDGVWIRRIFISGTTAAGLETFQMNRLLELEQREHNDILQWDFRDSFFNLTMKQILFLEWMDRNCPKARFLLNGDDDIFANTDNMVAYLQGLEDNDGSKHLFVGELIESVGPIRKPNSKYYIPVQVQVSDSYPPYCGGGGFLLSGYTAAVVYKMSHSIEILPIDDVYMGMCLRKAGLSPRHHIGVYTLYLPIGIDTYGVCFYREIILAHRYLPPMTYIIWNIIHDSNLKCGAKGGQLDTKLSRN